MGEPVSQEGILSRWQLASCAAFLLAVVLMLGLAAPTAGQGNRGLLGEYFDNKNLTGLKLSRIDPVMNFAWGNASPDPALAPNTFSVRWTGWVVPRYSETYTFITRSDDGVRLWIKGRLVIDNWSDHLATQNQGRIALTTGVKHPIKLEYYDNAGPAELSLRWRSASQSVEIIPRSQLAPAAQGANSPSPTRTRTSTRTPTKKATSTRTSTRTPTKKATATRTATRTATLRATATRTPTRTVTLRATATRTPTRTAIPTVTYMPTPTEMPIQSAFFGLDIGLGEVILQPEAVRLAQDTGVTLVRDSVYWRDIEPVEGTFDFSKMDDYLNAMTNAGFIPVIYISNNPTWAANIPCGPIDTNDSAKMAALSNFMFTLAARYPEIKVWALYNEPDNAAYVWNGYSSGGCFGDHKTNDLNGNGVNDRADYARMLAAAWKAVHQANPQAQLAMGAVAYDFFDSTAPPWYGSSGGYFNYNFLPELFAYIQAHPLPNGEQYMDLMLFNYFDFFGWIWQQVASGRGIQAKTQELREQMAAYGLSFPLLVSESGADSREVGTEGQAICLNIIIVRGQAAGLRGVLWWTFKDHPESNQFYGVVDATLAPKPSYYAYQTLTRELYGYRYNATRTNTTGFTKIEAYEFKKGTSTKIVLWASPIAQWNGYAPCASTRVSQTAQFGPDVTRLRMVELTGAELFVNDNGSGDLDTRVGYIGVTISGSPRFVQPDRTLTPIATSSPTRTPSRTATLARTATRTATRAATLVRTPTRTPTRTATVVRTATRTPTRTATLARTATRTPTRTALLALP